MTVNISASDEYKYGINNISINFTFKNVGNKHAFNVFTEIFDNNTFSKINKSNLLMPNSEVTYQLNFTDFSDFEITVIADSNNLVEESDETNNAQRFFIKLNNKPILNPINNITVKETDTITINLSAFDADNGNLTFSINSSKFSKNNNIFVWKTTKNDSSIYALLASVSDGFLSDSAEFTVIVLDLIENDMDNDGINDSIDNLIGNEKSINTSTVNLSIFIGNSDDLSRFFNKTSHVKFYDNNLTIMEFEFDFSHNRLNLTNITIDKQLANQTTKEICVKDFEIANIHEISEKCNLKNEIKLMCNSKPKKSYKCSYNETTNKYKVFGLKNSGIVQIIKHPEKIERKEIKKEEIRSKEKPKTFFNFK